MCLSENKEQEKKKSIQVHRCVYPKTKNKVKKKQKQKEKKERRTQEERNEKI